jgi:signal transduction histidine kinase
VWINYLTNALKHGGETERIELGGKRMDNGTAHFWVRDYGPGISPEAQRKLFQPFSRFDYTTEGHGLGLSIVKRIVEKLGGEAGVESTPGEGSTFYFTLPLAQDTDNAPD